MTEAIDFTDELLRKAMDAWDNGHLDTALRIYKRLAAMGVIDAMNCLGTLLDNRIQPHDPQGAIYWYVRAVRMGDASSAWNLAMHYVPRNNQRWYHFWMAKAEEMGDEDASTEMTKIRADPDYMTKLPWQDADDETE